MRINKSWTLAALAAVGLAAAIAVGTPRLKAAAPDKKGKPPAPLEFTARDVVRLAPHALITDLNAPGSIQAVSQATVRAKLSAEVRRVLVREGERVTAGQVVAEFDTASLRAQANIMPIACSATAWLFEPMAASTAMPRRFAATLSIASMPTPWREITLSLGEAASTRSLKRP